MATGPVAATLMNFMNRTFELGRLVADQFEMAELEVERPARKANRSPAAHGSAQIRKVF